MELPDKLLEAILLGFLIIPSGFIASGVFGIFFLCYYIFLDNNFDDKLGDAALYSFLLVFLGPPIAAYLLNYSTTHIVISFFSGILLFGLPYLYNLIFLKKEKSWLSNFSITLLQKDSEEELTEWDQRLSEDPLKLL